MRTFTVYGGCITRDIFNHLDNYTYKPILTIGQNPISTMFEPPINIELEDFICGSTFDKRMLYYDSNKLALNKILEENSDYFIFDGICERITVMEIGYDGKIGRVEKSWPFVDNWLKLVKMDKYKKMKKVRDIDVMELAHYDEKINRFCDLIANKYPSNRIIFCELELVKDYLTKEKNICTFNTDTGYKLISKYNDPDYGNSVIEYVQKRIKRNLPDIHYIPMPDYVLADENHHFGLHPLHYTEEYYKYASVAVELIVRLENPELARLPLAKLCELQSKNNKLLKERSG